MNLVNLKLFNSMMFLILSLVINSSYSQDSSTQLRKQCHNEKVRKCSKSHPYKKLSIEWHEFDYQFINRQNLMQNKYIRCQQKAGVQCVRKHKTAELANKLSEKFENANAKNGEQEIARFWSAGENREKYKRWCGSIGGQFSRKDKLLGMSTNMNCYCAGLKKYVTQGNKKATKEVCIGSSIENLMGLINGLNKTKDEDNCFYKEDFLKNFGNDNLTCPSWLDKRIKAYSQTGALNYFGTQLIGTPEESCKMNTKDDPFKDEKELENYLSRYNKTTLGGKPGFLSKCIDSELSSPLKKRFVAEYYHNMLRLKQATLGTMENLNSINNLLGVSDGDYFSSHNNKCGDPRIAESQHWCNELKKCKKQGV